LLLTILGEFALSADAPIWTATLIGALGTLRVEEKAARQALARIGAEGILESERVGRKTRWSLSTAGRLILREGANKIYNFMRERPRWDGQWLVLAVTVPDPNRQLRHRLRTRLTWAGLGSPAPGLWVTPNRHAVEEVSTIIDELGLANDAMSWIGGSGTIGEPQEIVRSAWRLTEVETAYARFIERFSARSPRRGAGTFAAQVELVQDWRRFPFVDPALPLELLNHEWPGLAAAVIFHSCHDEWHRAAQAYWRQMCAQ
jgi:phenylacetic acid degradation operon negative regulatory protein